MLIWLRASLNRVGHRKTPHFTGFSSCLAVIVDNIHTGLAKSFRGSFNRTRSMTGGLIDALWIEIPRSMRPSTMILVPLIKPVNGFNLARMAAVLSRLPIETTGTAVSRFCASGLQAVPWQPNKSIQASQYHDGGRGQSISMRSVRSPVCLSTIPDFRGETTIYMEMGRTAEVVAERYGVSRGPGYYALQSRIAMVSRCVRTCSLTRLCPWRRRCR